MAAFPRIWSEHGFVSIAYFARPRPKTIRRAGKLRCESSIASKTHMPWLILRDKAKGALAGPRNRLLTGLC